MEWLLSENIRNLESIDIDRDSLFQLRDAFKRYLDEELKSRDHMEKMISSFYGKGSAKKQIKSHIIMLENREKFDEDAFQCKYCTDLCYFSMIKCSEHTCGKPDSNASEEANKPVTKYSKRRQTSSKQKNDSSQSSVTESEQYCIHHLGYCGCEVSNYTVVYRFSTKELLDMNAKIQEACRVRDSSVEEVKASGDVKLIPKLKPSAVVYNKTPNLVNLL